MYSTFYIFCTFVFSAPRLLLGCNNHTENITLSFDKKKIVMQTVLYDNLKICLYVQIICHAYMEWRIIICHAKGVLYDKFAKKIVVHKN